jgi:dihydroorotate dehydrogenase
MSFLWEKLARPVLFRMDAETAHEIGINALAKGLARPFADRKDFAGLSTERFGLKFDNPLGIAAGFDKNGIAVNQLASLGFGFVEVGTVTFEPQTGNEKPRMFRLPEDKALINRLGFNNQGAETVAKRLSAIDRKCVIGVNIGKNKSVPNEEAVKNYLKSFDLVHPVADYIAINISSPNTPDLRELQKAENLEELLAALQKRNREISGKPPKGGTQDLKPILVKIAPDLSEAEIEAAVDICQRHEIAGIIATNTTVSREGLKTKDVLSFGDGGLSGKPLANRSNEVISTIFRYSRANLPIIGVGGIITAEDAFEKIAAGASLIQAYTGFIYGGPSFAGTVNEGLAEILKKKGFDRLDDAIGSSAR